MLPLSVTRIGITWLIMAIAMTMNGIGRELVLKRVVSPVTADMFSAIIGMTLIGLIAMRGLQPIALQSPRMSQLIGLSLALVTATIVFECVIGRYVDHKSWLDLTRHYYIWRGELWPVVLLWLASMPFVIQKTTSNIG
jgi:hypothetical protein